MADWTANSSAFGARKGAREPLLQAPREPVETRTAAALRAERAFTEEMPPRATTRLAEYNSRQRGALAKARVALWTGGGIVSLLLVAGVGVWGYKLVLRDVIGLPIVVAAEGPMRVLPADPEGEIVPSQGLAVNAIPAVGTVASSSDILVLAPQTPDLAEEDMEVVQTMAEAGEVVPSTVNNPSSAPNVETSTQASAVSSLAQALAAPTVVAAPLTLVEALPLSGAPTSPAPSAVEEPDQQMGWSAPADETATAEATIAVADQVADGVEPLSPTPEAAPAPLDTARSAVTVLPPEVPGVVSATRPVARPATLTTDAAPGEVVPPVAAAPASLPVTPEPVAPVAPTAAVAAGTHLVQLGAFDSPEIAASEWARLQGRFRDFLGARDYVIQETQSGGRTLYRLRALGFPERADARILCAALTAEGADCIPVTVD